MVNTNKFIFRVANNFFGSNSDKTRSITNDTCSMVGANLLKFDDSDTSCHGYSGFYVKIELDREVNSENFLNIFRDKCNSSKLEWGQDKDKSICLASDKWLSINHKSVDFALIAKKFIL